MSMTSWINSPPGLPGSGLDLAVRATILLAIALGTWRAVGRRRPLIGSAIGQAGLLGLLILPFSARLGPSLSIPLLAAAAAPAGAAPRIAEAQDPEDDRSPARDEAAIDPVSVAAQGHPPLAREGAVPTGEVVPAPRSPRPTINPVSIIFGLYALAAIALLARLARLAGGRWAAPAVGHRGGRPGLARRPGPASRSPGYRPAGGPGAVRSGGRGVVPAHDLAPGLTRGPRPRACRGDPPP